MAARRIPSAPDFSKVKPAGATIALGQVEVLLYAFLAWLESDLETEASNQDSEYIAMAMECAQVAICMHLFHHEFLFLFRTVKMYSFVLFNFLFLHNQNFFVSTSYAVV